MTIVEIFKQLKEARLAANRSLRDVSKACGVAEPTLSMAESGRRSGMRGQNLVAWAAALGLELTLTPVGPGSTSPEPGPTVEIKVEGDWADVSEFMKKKLTLRAAESTKDGTEGGAGC